MKYIFKPAPNYRVKDSTMRIMLDLTLGLLIVWAFALYNASAFSGANVSHLIGLTIASILTSVVAEALYAVFTKQDVKKFLLSSFPWVTPLIIVLISPMNVSIYAMIMCTFLGVVFGKLVFGGFGQNVFNPAAVARAIIFASFMGSVAADVVTGATPTSSMAALGWSTSFESFSLMLEQFGGIQGLLIGNYAGALGETSSIIIILVGIYLSVRKVIDWRTPVVYLLTIFCGAALVGAIQGMGIWYPAFHVLTGGAMFGAVFMLTDPVTNPTTRIGRIVFAIGAGLLTLIIRLMANLPEGVLYSILIMNMLTPMIDRLFDGQQFRETKKYIISLVVMVVVGAIVVGGAATTLVKGEMPTEESYNAGPKMAFADEYPSFAAEIIEQNGDVYLVEAKGFEGKNLIEVTMANGVVENVSISELNDTPGICDLAANPAFLKAFVGASMATGFEVDAVSSATMTSKSVASAVKTVIESAN